ncbi:MAG: hypothetical protein KQH79_07905 [Bacteroidetes bacterium]|nr:hypothetical protein [Bacteroidota bacterium]
MNIEHRIINTAKKCQQIKLNLIRYLIFVIFICLSSCANPYKNLPSTKLNKADIQKIPYALPHSDETLIYKADIRFYKNDIGGLLIIKKIEEKVFRIALTTQFGLKLFDFELNNGELQVEYCVEYLNKKVILNTFQTDFNLLLMQNQFDGIHLIDNKDQNQRIWQFAKGNLNYNYIENINTQRVVNMNLSKRNSEKISVGLYAYRGDIPGEIKLEHHNIKLNMDLKLIQ